MIIYRWYSSIEGAEDINKIVVKLIESDLIRNGETVWRDENDLDISAKLSQAVKAAMEHTCVVIIYIGVHDLER